MARAPPASPSHPYEVAALLADAYRLTPREREVVALAVRGHSNTEIANALWLSLYTVQDHLKNAFDKVGVSGRSELAAKLFFDHSPTLDAPAVHRVIGQTYPG